MNVGDRVTTPHGPATIIDIRPHGQWTFGRYRPQPLLIVRYPGGHRHAWVSSKVKPIMRTTIKRGARMTTEQPDPETTEQPNPDQTELQPDPEPDKPSTDDEPEEEEGDDAGQEDQ